MFSFNRLYKEAGMEPERARSLNCMLHANMCGNLCGIICGGGTAAMVGLAGYFNATDLQLGLLVAIPQIASLLQLPFSVLVNKTRKRKQYILTWGLFSRFTWLWFGLLPVIFGVEQGKTAMFVLLGILALNSALGAMINVCWFPWFSDVAPISIRGRWFSYRDMINSGMGLTFGLVVAYMLDHLPLSNKYLIVFIIGGIFGMADMLFFGGAKDKWGKPAAQVQFKAIFKDIIKCKPFIRFTIMWTVWAFTANMSDAYMTPYAMNVMGLNFMQYTIFGTVTASLATMLFIPRWGSLLDRCGGKNVMLIACVVASLSPLFYLFSVPGSIWPTLLRNLVGAAFWCGCNLACNSMQLSTSPDGNRASYIAVFSCITSLAGGALGTMCGGAFLDFCSGAGLFTSSFDRYKVLFLVASMLRLASTLIIVPGLQKDSDVTIKDMLKMAVRR